MIGFWNVHKISCGHHQIGKIPEVRMSVRQAWYGLSRHGGLDKQAVPDMNSHEVSCRGISSGGCDAGGSGACWPDHQLCD